VGVSDLLTIDFADTSAQIAGVATAGLGTLLARAGQLTAAPPPQVAAPEDDGGAWTVSSPNSYELSLAPLGPAAAFVQGTIIWLCRATGMIDSQKVDGLAALSRRPRADAFALERRVAIFFDAQLAFALAARRPRGAGGHGEEQLEAIAFRGEPLEVASIEIPRLSTTYDADGLPTHAGVELWETDEAELALRIGGEVFAGGELAHPDGARTRVSFVAWHHDGRHSIGSYAITTFA
jgi:hypothetical protein